MPQSQLPKIGFYLERLTKDEIREVTDVYDGGNLSRTMNLALEYYLELRKKGDRGLDKFIRERAAK